MPQGPVVCGFATNEADHFLRDRNLGRHEKEVEKALSIDSSNW